MSKTTLLFLAILLSIPSSHSQNLDPADVRISSSIANCNHEG